MRLNDLCWVRYSDLKPKPPMGGASKFFMVWIREPYRGDKGLLEHEKMHVRQSYLGLFIIHQLAYTFSKWYRLQCEVQAYKEQLKHYDDDRSEMFAGFIANHYNLDVTQEEALELLTK